MGTARSLLRGPADASCLFPGLEARPDVSTGGPTFCCNANSDPCCPYLYCDASLTPSCSAELACKADGGTFDPYIVQPDGSFGASCSPADAGPGDAHGSD
jgi:hypothetical protein